MKKTVKVGNVVIGDGKHIPIQSMCNIPFTRFEELKEQSLALQNAGCEILRYAFPDKSAAEWFSKIKETLDIPVVADIHFDYRLALEAIAAGADKIRINPGNIGSKEKTAMVARAAKMHGIPIRVGANTGSLKKELANENRREALVKSALLNIRELEEQGFYDIVVSLKSSDVINTVRAYRKMSEMVDYPLHLGVTEAVIYSSSVVKSSIGIGGLLIDGIGDTVRASVTGDPVKEIALAKDILRYSGARSFGCEVIACPTCARTKIDIESLAEKVSEATKNIDKNLKIAVMGCVVNGPGEAREADIGIAGGKNEGLIFIKGEPYKKVSEDKLLDELLVLIERL